MSCGFLIQFYHLWELKITCSFFKISIKEPLATNNTKKNNINYRFIGKPYMDVHSPYMDVQHLL